MPATRPTLTAHRDPAPLGQLARDAHSDHSLVPVLVDALTIGGFMSPEDAATARLEPGSLEHGSTDLFLRDGRVIRVWFDGCVLVGFGDRPRTDPAA